MNFYVNFVLQFSLSPGSVSESDWRLMRIQDPRYWYGLTYRTYADQYYGEKISVIYFFFFFHLALNSKNT